jgi:hypothetical protein
MMNSLGGEHRSNNVFEALFEFRPQENRTSEENFLTEALIYTLRSCKPAALAWLSLMTGEEIKARGMLLFETRASHDDPDQHGTIYPDVSVSGIDTNDRKFRVLVEHKWNAAIDEGQRERYARLKVRGEILYFAFVYVRKADREIAHSFRAPRGVHYVCCKWEDVFACLAKVRSRSGVLAEFLQFMVNRGLNPGESFSRNMLLAHARHQAIASRAVDNRRSALRRQLPRFCEKLLYENDWSFVPKGYLENVWLSDRDGRAALDFYKTPRGPEFTIGFYYDTANQRAPFADPRKGMDVALRVLATPRTNPEPERLMEHLGRLAPTFRRTGAMVRLKGEPGNGNLHTLLLVQRSLLDIIDGIRDDEGQVAAIYEVMARWCRILFGDRRVVLAFETIRPY